jgi:hypothetical protein
VQVFREARGVEDPTLARLEDQIGWYDAKSGSAQRTLSV